MASCEEFFGSLLFDLTEAKFSCYLPDILLPLRCPDADKTYLSRLWSYGTIYKVVGLLKRPEGMAMADFRLWWLEVHAPKVKKWKGVTRYCVNLCTTDDQRYDGMAET